MYSLQRRFRVLSGNQRARVPERSLRNSLSLPSLASVCVCALLLSAALIALNLTWLSLAGPALDPSAATRLFAQANELFSPPEPRKQVPAAVSFFDPARRERLSLLHQKLPLQNGRVLMSSTWLPKTYLLLVDRDHQCVIVRRRYSRECILLAANRPGQIVISAVSPSLLENYLSGSWQALDEWTRLVKIERHETSCLPCLMDQGQVWLTLRSVATTWNVRPQDIGQGGDVRWHIRQGSLLVDLKQPRVRWQITTGPTVTPWQASSLLLRHLKELAP